MLFFKQCTKRDVQSHPTVDHVARKAACSIACFCQNFGYCCPIGVIIAAITWVHVLQCDEEGFALLKKFHCPCKRTERRRFLQTSHVACRMWCNLIDDLMKLDVILYELHIQYSDSYFQTSRQANVQGWQVAKSVSINNWGKRKPFTQNRDGRWSP